MSRSPNNKLSIANPARLVRWLGRGIGLLLILGGCLGLLLALLEVWNLYQSPERILPLAQAIEDASGIDRILLGKMAANSAAAQASGTTLILPYFLAWTLALFLLSVLGRIASHAISAGRSLLELKDAYPLKQQEPYTPEDQTDLPGDYRPSHRKAQR